MAASTFKASHMVPARRLLQHSIPCDSKLGRTDVSDPAKYWIGQSIYPERVYNTRLTRGGRGDHNVLSHSLESTLQGGLAQGLPIHGSLGLGRQNGLCRHAPVRQPGLCDGPAALQGPARWA